MDELDRRILDALQNDFPIRENPYEVIAGKLGIELDQLWQRVQALMAEGTIRRMGVSLNSRKMGYPSTLCAVRVPGEQVDEAAEYIGSFVEVTHSYQRDDRFNIWFTLIAASEQRIDEVLESIRERLKLGENDVLNLPMKTTFKLNARFKAR